MTMVPSERRALRALIEDLETDSHVAFYLASGAMISGFLNEWDWDNGIVNLRADQDRNVRQFYVPLSMIIALRVS